MVVGASVGARVVVVGEAVCGDDFAVEVEVEIEGGGGDGGGGGTCCSVRRGCSVGGGGGGRGGVSGVCVGGRGFLGLGGGYECIAVGGEIGCSRSIDELPLVVVVQDVCEVILLLGVKGQPEKVLILARDLHC
jgi:hypothetical protein